MASRTEAEVIEAMRKNLAVLDRVKAERDGWKASFGHENARLQEAQRTIDRLWAVMERCVESLTTYTQAFGESDQERPAEDGGDFTICCVCGQDIEEPTDHDAGCYYPKAMAALGEAKALLDLRDVRAREGGGGGAEQEADNGTCESQSGAGSQSRRLPGSGDAII